MNKWNWIEQLLCSAGVDNKMDLAPLRTLDDFILQGSRFQVPDINQVSSLTIYFWKHNSPYKLSAEVEKNLALSIFGQIELPSKGTKN